MPRSSACPTPGGASASTAVLVAAPGARIDEDALVARCRAELAGYKIPRRLVIVDELPRNATGKIDKPELRRRLAATLPDAVGA